MRVADYISSRVEQQLQLLFLIPWRRSCDPWTYSHTPFAVC